MLGRQQLHRGLDLFVFGLVQGLTLGQRQVIQQFLEGGVLRALAQHLDVEFGDAQRPAGLDPVARHPAFRRAGQGRLNGGLEIAERLQRLADFALGVVVQPVQADFVRRGFAGETVEFQKSQYVVAQRAVHAFDGQGQGRVGGGRRFGSPERSASRPPASGNRTGASSGGESNRIEA
jgi:hypothetical protein